MYGDKRKKNRFLRNLLNIISLKLLPLPLLKRTSVTEKYIERISLTTVSGIHLYRLIALANHLDIVQWRPTGRIYPMSGP